MADAKSGRSGALVLRGEAGIGKTALLDYAESAAGGMRVLRVVGLDSEADVTYSALHLMFSCDLDRLDALPAGQAQALRAAFGLGDGLVEGMLPGAATLSLLSEIAGNKPLLCLLDDAQWFDQSSIDALLFAVRRLHNDPIAVIFAVRDGGKPVSGPRSGQSRARTVGHRRWCSSCLGDRCDRGDRGAGERRARPRPRRDRLDRLMSAEGGCVGDQQAGHPVDTDGGPCHGLADAAAVAQGDDVRREDVQ
ncbi:AAA family ATPase [Actinomadura madurae]|uniref:AAA family ATPase n=1 Tax=Actinomadura madurae TaxID=1993 RepID=UPI003558375C